MTPVEFKSLWNSPTEEVWSLFNQEQLSQGLFQASTNEWLINGLPRDAAPMLSFQASGDYKVLNKFVNQYPDYSFSSEYDGLWVIGSDGSGSPLCIDALNADLIVLLDHDFGFKIEHVNLDLSDLSKCILAYKRFIDNIQSEIGEDAFIDYQFSQQHIDQLKSSIEIIRPAILEHSIFWKREVDQLYGYIS